MTAPTSPLKTYPIISKSLVYYQLQLHKGYFLVSTLSAPPEFPRGSRRVGHRDNHFQKLIIVFTMFLVNRIDFWRITIHFNLPFTPPMPLEFAYQVGMLCHWYQFKFLFHNSSCIADYTYLLTREIVSSTSMGSSSQCNSGNKDLSISITGPSSAICISPRNS